MQRLNALRRSRDWTWQQTAKAVGMSRTMIHFIKTGKHPVSRNALELLETAEEAAEFLDPADPKFNKLLTLSTPVTQTERDIEDTTRGELVSQKSVLQITEGFRLRGLTDKGISLLYEHFVVASNRVHPEFAKYYVLICAAISKELERRWKATK